MQKIGLFLLFIWCWSCTTDASQNSKHRLPQTIVKPKKGKEGEGRKKRKEWIDYMHKSAPDVDWRAVDRETRWQKYQASLLASQKNTESQESFANGLFYGQWFERGSANNSGRIWSADLDTVSGKIYALSDGGNVWKGNLNGTQWQVLNDQLKFSAGFLRVLPLTTSNRRILTGGGQNVWFSDNDGNTWNASTGLSNLQQWGYIKRMHVANDPASTVWLLVLEWDFVDWESITSLYYSSNKGQSFTKYKSFKNSVYQGVDKFDIWTDRYADVGLYLAQNDSVFFTASPTQSLTFKSTFPASQITQLYLTGSANNGNPYLYIYTNDAYYRSTNSGNSWAFRSSNTDGIFSPASFNVSLSNPNVVYNGQINAIKSTNGASSFSTINEWYEYYGDIVNKLHADIPAIIPIRTAQGVELTFICTDGGLYISNNQLGTVTNLSLDGLNVSQYYSIYTHQTEPRYVYAGSQDQGFQRNTLDTAQLLGFDQVISGDYGHIVSGDGGNSVFMVYPGFIDYYQDAKSGISTAGLDFEPWNNTFWMPPLTADPLNLEACYLAGGSLQGSGSHLIHIVYNGSDLIPTELPTDFSTLSSGGNISAFAISPINSNYWYVLTDNGRFFYSNNAGSSWSTNSSLNSLGAQYLYGATILPSKITLGNVYIGGSGYSNPPAFYSSNHGQTFTAITTGLPSTHIFQLAANTDESVIFAATEVGPYAYIPNEQTWYDIRGAGAPDQTYWSVEFIPLLNRVRFGTYGRGIWDLEIQFPASAPVANNQDFQIYPNPATAFFTVKTNQINSFVRVFSMQGTLVYEGYDAGTISCANWPRGVYVITVNTGKSTISKKIILS